MSVNIITPKVLEIVDCRINFRVIRNALYSIKHQIYFQTVQINKQKLNKNTINSDVTTTTSIKC